MVSKCIILSGLLFIICSAPAPAQNTDSTYQELERFQEEAGKLSILYRGKRAEKYNFSYNGTYFWDSPSFQSGDVSYNGKLYCNVNLNLDASRQIPLVCYGETMIDISLVPELVEWFSMDGRRFDNLSNSGVAGAENGFYELLYNGRSKLYKRVNKFLKISTSNVNGKGIGYDDPKYREEVLSYFAINVRYFLLTEDGRFIQIKSRSSIARAFPDHKKELNRIQFRDLEEYSINALKYLEK